MKMIRNVTWGCGGLSRHDPDRTVTLQVVVFCQVLLSFLSGDVISLCGGCGIICLFSLMGPEHIDLHWPDIGLTNWICLQGK